MAVSPAKYREQPIISVLAGYQRFVARRESKKQFVKSVRSRRSKPFDLYRLNGKAVQGSYVGNHIVAQYYSPVGNINKKQLEGFNSAFRNLVTNSNSIRLNKLLTKYQNPKTYQNIKVTGGGSGSPEEQTSAIGSKSPRITRRPGQAQEVDIREPFGNFQVTTQRLDDPTHHSIFGQAGRNLSRELKDIKKRFEGRPHAEREMHQKMAEKGYEYFKGRLPQWNVVLDKIQTSSKGIAPANVSIRDTLVQQMSGGGIETKSSVALQGMFKNTTGFMGEGTAQITSTALGNMQEFGQGVSYTFVIDPYTHAVIQQFKMENRQGRLRWAVSALKRNLTEVVYSYMATDEKFKSLNNLSNYDNASRRFFAEVSNRGNKNKHTTEVGKLNAVATGLERVKGGRFTANIDMVHANKSMARHIKNELLPAIKRDLAKDAKKYTKKHVGEPIDLSGSLMHGNSLNVLWAAPYLSVADYGFEAFEDGHSFN